MTTVRIRGHLRPCLTIGAPDRLRPAISGHGRIAARGRHRLADTDPVTAASRVLGSILTVGEVRARIVEVEAYGSPEDGPWPDPPHIRIPVRRRVTG